MPMDDKANLILKLLRDEALFQAPAPGRAEVSEAAFALTRFDAAVKPARCLHYPLIALVIQGEKRAFYGEREVVYGTGQYVVLCHDMPGIYQITGASAVDPFLSVSLRINPRVLLDLSVEYGLTSPERKQNISPVGIDAAPEELLLAFYRLLIAIRKNRENKIYIQSIVKEIHYHILIGPLGDYLKFAIAPGANENSVALSLTWLREHFRESFSMPELARLANMSVSTFNRAFRRATSVSPLQFQKRLRLYEAQRLMLMENLDARSAAASVGYESEAQFSREYKRLFGLPPFRDVSSLRY